MSIQDFDDFCLWVYCVVDEIMHPLQPVLHRPGPLPTTGTDSELIAMAIIGECRGWDQETEVLAHFAQHRDLFPRQPEQSRFNRRCRNLMPIFNLVRRAILRVLDVAQDALTVIDRLPVPVVNVHLVPQSHGDWKEHGAAFSKVPSKKQMISGYKLHLLVTVGGVIVDFELAPANAPDLMVGEELLEEHCDLVVIGDKASISAKVRPIADAARD